MAQLTIDQALARAVQHQQSRQYGPAEQLYRQVLAVMPQHPDALHLLGVVLLDTGRADQAVDLIGRAIAAQPQVADFHYNLGVAWMALRRPEQAVESFSRAVSLRPEMFAARANLAAAQLSLGRYDQAEDTARAALALQPDHADLLNNVGVALKERGKLDEALQMLQRAVAVRPDLPEALTNLGNTFQRMGRYSEAVAAHQRAVATRPSAPELQNNLGSALYDALEYEQAIEAFRRAIALRPDYREATCTLANCYYRLGRLAEAIPIARQAISLWPDSPLPKFNLSLMLLSNGEFEEGWRLNESRWNIRELNGPQRNFGKPRWDGSDLSGKTILLYGEQGFGDTIQFIRYVPMVRNLGAKIILGCQSELLRLLKQVEGVERVVSRSNGAIEFDTHCPLMSLPMMFGTNLSNIPASVSYLKADPELSRRWDDRFAADTSRLKVGIAWAGRPTHDNDRNRSIALNQLAPLAEAADVSFYSLQKGEAAKQAMHPPAGMKLADLSGDIQDFADLAALIAHLDLVITVDTAAAHLSAAMGKPTWVLLPYAPDWRWLTGREDSPWYPTLRLFRQPQPRDWASPIVRAADALRQRAASPD